MLVIFFCQYTLGSAYLQLTFVIMIENKLIPRISLCVAWPVTIYHPISSKVLYSIISNKCPANFEQSIIKMITAWDSLVISTNIIKAFIQLGLFSYLNCTRFWHQGVCATGPSFRISDSTWYHRSFYITSRYSTRIFYRGVSDFATDCPCGVWYRGLPTYLLYVCPRFRNPLLAVGLTEWIANHHFVVFWHIQLYMS